MIMMTIHDGHQQQEKDEWLEQIDSSTENYKIIRMIKTKEAI